MNSTGGSRNKFYDEVIAQAQQVCRRLLIHFILLILLVFEVDKQCK